MKKGLRLMVPSSRQRSPDIQTWSCEDLVSFLQERGVREDLVDALRTQQVSGRHLYDKEALICAYTEQEKVRGMQGCRGDAASVALSEKTTSDWGGPSD